MKQFVCILVVGLHITWCSADEIHYWRFEEGNGSVAAASVGDIHGDLFYMPSVNWSDSVATPTIPLTGAANNYSLYFGGAGFVDISDWHDMNLGTAFTIEFYFNPEQPFGLSPFFGFGSGGLGYGPGLGYLLAESSGTNYFDGGFMGNNVDEVPANFLILNEWHHLALVKTQGQYSLYVDGSLIATQLLPSSADGPYNFAGETTGGTRTIGNGFRGYIDEFRISNTALTPTQFLNFTE